MENSPRKTLNEILLEEVTELRRDTSVLEGYTASSFGDDEACARNLRDLYSRIGKLTPADASKDEGLSALCFSGGGIRSATFNLGILRGLAKRNLLRSFDYLSSVSGGGYIASWVRTWIWREGLAKNSAEGALDAVEDALACRAAGRDPLAPEPRQLDHLREYSNYLTPQLGLFSPDTWTLAAIAVRNLLLNWLVILPALSLVTCVPLFVLLVVRIQHLDTQFSHSLLWAAVLVATFASLLTHTCRRFAKGKSTGQGFIVTTCIVPTCIAATLLSTAALGFQVPDEAAKESAAYFRHLWEFAGLWCVAIPAAGWVAAEAAFLMQDGNVRNRSLWIMAFWELVGLIFSGVVAAIVLVVLVRLAFTPLYDHPIAYSVLAFPTLLSVYLLARTIFVAFASLADRSGSGAPAFGLEDSDREWWARLSGWILMAAAMWLILATICLCGTAALSNAKDYKDLAHSLVAAVGGVSGILAAVLGASSKTAGSEASKAKAKQPAWVGWVLAIAAPLFAVCAFLLIAQGTIKVEEASLRLITGVPDVFGLDPKETATHNLAAIECVYFLILPLMLALFMIAFGRIVNVNRFSLHGMYRNRLVRSYLGASNTQRTPDPFTGFADDDNPSLHQLWSHDVPIRPMPLINVALNLVKSGDKLAWQQRKAESFSMTPLYCGNFHEGYRQSKCYGGPHGISVGTAVTISGAAANPNMGSNSSPAISFLLALFNLRLGAWLGNTNEHGDSTCARTGPLQALLPLLAELFGLTTANSKYVNLSDGGHFENLGLYEVVLRRCRQIVVCDAGCDPDCSYEDLGNAIRKIRIDFGIEIVFHKAIRIYPRSDKGDNGVYCAIGKIVYSCIDGDDAPDGRILYIKPTIRAAGKPVPYDVYSYAEASDAFPHESTADQWFNESQFESYRALGTHAIDEIVEEKTITSVHEFIDHVESHLAKAERLAATKGALGAEPPATTTPY